MRILVAGATGVVGRPLVPMLLERGHTVIAMSRGNRSAEVTALGAEVVRVDALDRAAVIAAVGAAKPDVIVHQLTALTSANLRNFDKAFAVTNQLRTQGTDNLLAAAEAAGVERVIAQSFTGWPNDPNGPAVQNEKDPLDPHPITTQRESLAAIRHVETVVPAAGGVVLRYGFFYGPGTNAGRGGSFQKLMMRRAFPIIGGGTGIWSFTHVRDAASATVAALTEGEPGLYNIVDDEPAPMATWLPEVSQIFGAKPPLRVPTWLGKLMAGEAIAHMATRVRGADNTKAKAELGWSPLYPSWRDGFRQDP